MRLIDADGLSAQIEDTAQGLADCDQQNAAWALSKYAIRDIAVAPTIDAAPVVHGRWVRTDYPEFCKGDFECSVCEHLECDIDTSILMPGVNCLYYCPNCGAKMDEGKGE